MHLLTNPSCKIPIAFFSCHWLRFLIEPLATLDISFPKAYEALSSDELKMRRNGARQRMEYKPSFVNLPKHKMRID